MGLDEVGTARTLPSTALELIGNIPPAEAEQRYSSASLWSILYGTADI
jgi:hypothetical protein